MDITWLGHSCFQLRGKNVTLVTDPFSPQFGDSTRLSKISASIITVSHDSPGHNYAQGLPAVNGKVPRVVRSPGEYEISDVLITGVAAHGDSKQGRNTIYIIHIDDIAVCHLGNLGQALRDDQLEEVADADVLLLPIGGEQNINVSQAIEVIGQVEPRIVIPMHYRPDTVDETSEEQTNPLAKFCREMGVDRSNVQSKLTVTRNTLANAPSELQVILLSAR